MLADVSVPIFEAGVLTPMQGAVSMQSPKVPADIRKEKGSGEKSLLLVALNLEIASCEHEKPLKILCACLGICNFIFSFMSHGQI